MFLINKIRFLLDYILSLVNPKLSNDLPKLSGNKQEDFINVAAAMCGKSGKDFGWHIDWCTFFVCWVARKSQAFKMGVKTNGLTFTIEYLKHRIGELFYFEDQTIDIINQSSNQKNHLSHCHKTNRDFFLPEKGDIVFYLWKSDLGKYRISHMGIVKDYKDGKLKVIEGNSTDTHLVKEVIREYDTQMIAFLRTNW